MRSLGPHLLYGCSMRAKEQYQEKWVSARVSGMKSFKWPVAGVRSRAKRGGGGIHVEAVVSVPSVGNCWQYCTHRYKHIVLLV